MLKTRCLSSKSNEPNSSSDFKVPDSEAIADLLDLEQGINQIDKISSSDPFGSLCRDNPYDPFDDSFSNKLNQPSSEKVLSDIITKPHHLDNSSSDLDKNSSFFESVPSTSKANFFCQFSPDSSEPGKFNKTEHKWFEQENDNVFDDLKINGSNNEQITSSSAVLNAPVPPESETVSVTFTF